MTYHLHFCQGGSISASEIIAKLDPAIPLQNAHIQAVRDLVAVGCRYSNQDFDVLAAAHRAIGETEVASYEQRWVEVMNEKAGRAS